MKTPLSGRLQEQLRKQGLSQGQCPTDLATWQAFLNSIEREHQELGAERENERAMLLQSAKMAMLGEMAAGIAHEVNTPLAVIKARLSVVRRKLLDLLGQRPDLAHDLQTIEKTTDRMAQIVSGLKSIARPGESDPMEITSVAAIIQEALAMCGQRFHGHKIELRISSNAQDAVAIRCRTVQVLQVIMNLLHNAHDAVLGRPGAWVEVTASVSLGQLTLSVTDSGAGISQVVVARMFHPFFTTKDNGKGTGLGLSIAKRLIEEHGGSLGYCVRNGHTSFYFTLPVAQALSTISSSDGEAAAA